MKGEKMKAFYPFNKNAVRKSEINSSDEITISMTRRNGFVFMLIVVIRRNHDGFSVPLIINEFYGNEKKAFRLIKRLNKAHQVMIHEYNELYDFKIFNNHIVNSDSDELSNICKINSLLAKKRLFIGKNCTSTIKMLRNHKLGKHNYKKKKSMVLDTILLMKC